MTICLKCCVHRAYKHETTPQIFASHAFHFNQNSMWLKVLEMLKCYCHVKFIECEREICTYISIEIGCIRFHARLIQFQNIGEFLFRCPFFGWFYAPSIIMVDDKMEFFGRFFMVLDILQFIFMTCHRVLDPKQMVWCDRFANNEC